MRQLMFTQAAMFGAICILGCSAGNTSGSSVTPPPGSGGGASAAGAGGPSTDPGNAGSGIIVGPEPTGMGGAGSNTEQQCDGKFTGFLRDFTIADPNGMVQSASSSPPIAETVNMVPYAVSPDFEVRLHDPTKQYVDDHTIVTAMLGMDDKPVYAGPASGTPTTTGPANFNTWFHDTPGVNVGQPLMLQFDKDATKPTDPNAYTFSSGPMGSACLGPSKSYCYGFYPIDGMLLGNEGNNHNYHMTFELHLKFKFHAGQTFRFQGDDDVWVYVNHKLAVDLGGLHQAQEEALLQLDTLGLTEGTVYPLDFFWCERHITASNFHIDTSLEVIDCGVVK